MLRHKANGNGNGNGSHRLKGKKILIPAMAYGSARAFAAAFRAVGLDAAVTPPSDGRTLELGARYTCGEECYPAKVTIGDFMKLLEQPETDPSRTVLFMAAASGPCRFGQYAPYMRRILDANGYGQTEVLSPSCDNAYQGLGSLSGVFLRTGWRALVAADILFKLLLRYRPYELHKGDSDAIYAKCLDDVCGAIERTPTAHAVQMNALGDCLVRCRDRFRSIPTRRERSRPVIGIVGEIFCRLNTFSNENLVERLEEQGGEAWMSDLSEWVWYSNTEFFRWLKLKGRLCSLDGLKGWIGQRFQRQDEHRLLEPFREDFAGREEPSIGQLLEYARPYLPASSTSGEMVLNVGKVIYLARKGVDGILDISPFTCMNGIVCEAIYPRLSRDLGGIPIRNFYFDGTQSDLAGDLGVFLELARTYQRLKAQPGATQPLDWGEGRRGRLSIVNHQVRVCPGSSATT